MKFYFPLHLDGGNRGCEAIAKGTAILLNVPKENLIGLCTDVELDKRLGTSDYVTLVEVPQMTKSKLLLRKAHRLWAFQHVKHMQYVYKQRYDSFLKSIAGLRLATRSILSPGSSSGLYTCPIPAMIVRSSRPESTLSSSSLS